MDTGESKQVNKKTMTKKTSIEKKIEKTKEEEKLQSIRLKEGYVLIESRIREGFKKKKDMKMLPPSDFFIVNSGETDFKEGQEIILDGRGVLNPLKGTGYFVCNSDDIVMYYE